MVSSRLLYSNVTLFPFVISNYLLEMILCSYVNILVFVRLPIHSFIHHTFSLFIYSQLHFEFSHCPLCAGNIDIPVFTELMEKIEKNPVNNLEYMTGYAKYCEEKKKN